MARTETYPAKARTPRTFHRATVLFTQVNNKFRTILRIKDFEGDDALKQVDKWHSEQQAEVASHNAQRPQQQLTIHINCFECYN